MERFIGERIKVITGKEVLFGKLKNIDSTNGILSMTDEKNNKNMELSFTVIENVDLAENDTIVETEKENTKKLKIEENIINSEYKENIKDNIINGENKKIIKKIIKEINEEKQNKKENIINSENKDNIINGENKLTSKTSDTSSKSTNSSEPQKPLKKFNYEKRKALLSRITNFLGPPEKILAGILSYNMSRLLYNLFRGKNLKVNIITKGTDIYNTIGYIMCRNLDGTDIHTELIDLNQFKNFKVAEEIQSLSYNKKMNNIKIDYSVTLFAMNRDELKTIDYKKYTTRHYIFCDVNEKEFKDKFVMSFIFGGIPMEINSIKGRVYYIDGGYNGKTRSLLEMDKECFKDGYVLLKK
ncbi:hypothetical protein SLOPH_555 [Spraguea lophii 42_110]|uniref:DUF5096 domain-containing protein n=1 Tax=Spraguea lophii (strain 42_110) TaxID=1358809 RepID=S7W8E1_SPRLO|nr:hypothetical protein SLOPH_555 [Spraguea lophii 42_110]